MNGTVERLYCKRPILCLASSKILTPTTFGAGGGHTRWVERGWGVYILEDVRHCSVLCTLYFVNGTQEIVGPPPPPQEGIETKDPHIIIVWLCVCISL
jgi:hypothetical protein